MLTYTSNHTILTLADFPANERAQEIIDESLKLNCLDEVEHRVKYVIIGCDGKDLTEDNINEVLEYDEGVSNILERARKKENEAGDEI